MQPASRPTPLAGPDYARGVHRLLPALTDHVTGDAIDPLGLGLPASTRRVAVLVVDGLGSRQLAEHAEHAPLLSGLEGPVLHAPFPSTTATSLAGIGTGRPPGEHGITGYSMGVRGFDEPLYALTWTWQRHEPEPALDARDEVVPERFQPDPTALTLARARGVRPVSVLRSEFVPSGLTRAGLRGGDVVRAEALDDTLAAVVTALEGPAPAVVYAHHGDLDMTGHLEGPATSPWRDELVRIDSALAALRRRLPADTAVIVTADHGMVAVPHEAGVELADRPDLLDGVRVLTGDARARQLFTEPGASERVAARWRAEVGEDADVCTRDEAVARGWFGPRVDERAAERIGDVIVTARVAAVAWVHRDLDLLGGRMAGMHGAATPEELEIPALRLDPAATR